MKSTSDSNYFERNHLRVQRDSHEIRHDHQRWSLTFSAVIYNSQNMHE